MPLEHSMTHRLAIKNALEEVLGRETWYELKESTSLTPWRKSTLKALKAIRLSILATISIRDDEWMKSIEENLIRGENGIRSSKDIDELLAHFEATLLRQVFLQIGLNVNFQGQPGLSLRKDNWKLDSMRSVQYVQSTQQIETAFWRDQQQRIGFRKQIELHEEYRQSKSRLPFSSWCRAREA